MAFTGRFVIFAYVANAFVAESFNSECHLVQNTPFIFSKNVEKHWRIEEGFLNDNQSKEYVQ